MSRQIKIHKSRMAAVTAAFLATIAALSNLPSYAQWDITTQTRGMPGVAPDAQTSEVDPSHEADDQTEQRTDQGNASPRSG